MGQEIVYCCHCQTQLRTADFERGAAFRVEAMVVCSSCSPKAFPVPLPPRTPPPFPAPLYHRTPPPFPAPEPTPGPARARVNDRPRSSTSAIPLVERPASEEVSGGNLGLILGGLGVVGLALLALILAGGGGGGARTAPAQPGPSFQVEAPLPRSAEPVPPPTAPIPSSSTLAGGLPKEKEAAARASLQKAQDYERRSPDDLGGQEPLYEQARWDARGTRFEEEANKAFEALQKKWKDRLEAEGAKLDGTLAAPLGRQDFKEAFRFLEEASDRSPRAAWKDILTRKRQELEARVKEAFLPLQAKALDAQKRGALPEVEALREKVGRWGLKPLSEDLERALASRPAPPPPAPVVSPEVAAYAKTWRRAMIFASTRASSQVVRELEEALRDLRDPGVRSEAIRDLDIAKKVATVLPEALGAIARWPKTSKIRLEYWDEGGQPKSAEGWIQKADLLEIELRRDREAFVIPTGELLPRTLAELFRSRASGRSPSDEPVLAYYLLGEGDASWVKDLPASGEAPAPKYRQWAQGLPEMLQAPDRTKREAEARGLFYGAERDRAACTGEADAVLKCKALLKDYADTPFVLRNRPLIERRAQGARDFAFLTEDLVGTGTFKQESSKSGIAWVSGTSPDPAVRKASFVEVQFSAVEDMPYRCWIYVGGCCAETLAFSVTGTELKGAVSAGASPVSPAEPTLEAPIPVKHSIGTSVRSHASHASGKRTLFWGWVEIPLAKYSQSGKKVLRVLPEHAGLMVRYVVVSSSRLLAPGDGEMRDMEKVRQALALLAARVAGNFIRDPKYDLGPPAAPQAPRAVWFSEGPAIAGLERDTGRKASTCWVLYYGDKSVTAWSAVTQRVPVAPQTNYELSVWIQTCQGFAGGACGARTQAGTILAQKAIAPSDGYMEYRISFNSGPNSYAIVFAGLGNAAGTNGWIHVDDWSLVER